MTYLTMRLRNSRFLSPIGPLQYPVTWYGRNYAGTQITLWDFRNKGILASPALLSFDLKVPLRYLCPSIIYSLPCDWILQRTYFTITSQAFRLDYQPLFGKGARAPPPNFFSGRVDQTRESGGNRAYKLLE